MAAISELLEEMLPIGDDELGGGLKLLQEAKSGGKV